MNGPETDGAAVDAAGGDTLTAAQRARCERQRLRARALRDARLPQRPGGGGGGGGGALAGLDSGGGFLLDGAEPAPRLRAPPAPLVHASEQPHCLLCDRPFPQSFLFDSFDYHVCDACRDDEDAHALIPRTEAKSEFLLKDCDLDARPPPLRCVRRRNPHRPGHGEMRLYLRAQVEERALAVWGSAERLHEERERRREARELLQRRRAQRHLRQLRMDVRSSLYDRSHAAHQHRYGPERPAADDDDAYERACLDCGHVQTYEKM
ncbi:DNA repair protein complementing XP-A cells homolog isoform X2 [Galleria mellonella]|uniref:DNA repair protein complementing XP-A cells homolog isoform X2 n=1 Tax=Galleria mellonella TaxID=7137 RepID=A0ABM3MBS6_GALME|nr:DNA repair protein complementing XP-A cells homolog isoform X2 [Galleria mellonella]